MILADFSWPAPIEPKSRKLGNDYIQFYPVPDIGECVRTTSFLKVVGTGTNSLMGWAEDVGRDTAIQAALDVASKHSIVGASEELRQAILERLGQSKKHVVAAQKQADIGNEAHKRIKWDLCGITKQKRVLDPPDLGPQSSIAYLAYRNWWDSAGLTPLRAEQTVWHRGLRYAGTVDLFALCPRRGLGILDWKSSKYVYDTHHMQIRAYMEAARDMGLPVQWGELIHLPKSAEQLTDKLVEPVQLGQMWHRKLSEQELWTLTQAALTLWRGLCEKRDEQV